MKQSDLRRLAEVRRQLAEERRAKFDLPVYPWEVTGNVGITNGAVPVMTNNAHNFQIAEGTIPGMTMVNKFGANFNVTTTFAPACVSGIYRTPQPAAATALRIKAGGNANDTALGTGAREITLQGLDATGAEVIETLATNGALASSATSTAFIRLYRWYVSKSGTYGTSTAQSHAGAITIENAAGTEDWSTIYATNFSRGQSQIGAYTVPLGKKAFFLGGLLQVDSTKPADFMFVQRRNILESAPPYSAMRILREFIGVDSNVAIHIAAGEGPFPALTDIGIFARVATGTGVVSVDMDFLIVDE